MKEAALVLALVALVAAVEARSGGGLGLGLGGGNDNLTAYELLQDYGFPVGLLPSNVVSYSLADDGKFELQLSGKCDVQIPGEYPVRYEKKITGKLSYDNVDDLSGVLVKVLFVWWDITAIRVSGSEVVFEVGLLSASYPATNFDESPDCGSALRRSSA